MAPQSGVQGARRVERSAVSAFIPVLAMVPFTLLAMAIIWLPLLWLFGVRYWVLLVVFLATGLLMFLRPVQAAVMTPLLGARHPTTAEADIIEPVWEEVAQVNGLPTRRFIVRVLPSDELNAYACGGHLVVVTSYAVRELTTVQLRGVLAHELSHHLGLHTVAITIGHWLSLPVVFLARIGFFLENVATAAADSFGRNSPLIEAVGNVAAVLIRGLSWVFTAAIRAHDALANFVGQDSEFEADQRVVRMGFGRELASALRQTMTTGPTRRAPGWRGRLAASHPPPRTRVARIEALLRHPAR